MSRELVRELVDALGVSKSQATEFVLYLNKKYLIDLVPRTDLDELVDVSGSEGEVGRPLSQEEIEVLDADLATDAVTEEEGVNTIEELLSQQRSAPTA